MTRIALAALVVAFALPACGGDTGADNGTTMETSRMSAALKNFSAHRVGNEVVASWKLVTDDMNALMNEDVVVEIVCDRVVATLSPTVTEWRGQVPDGVSEIFARLAREGVPVPGTETDAAPLAALPTPTAEPTPTAACPPEDSQWPAQGYMVCGDAPNLWECRGTYEVVVDFGCTFGCMADNGDRVIPRGSLEAINDPGVCRPHPDRR